MFFSLGQTDGHRSHDSTLPKTSWWIENCTKFGQFILSKIIKITTCQILRLECTKFDFSWAPPQSPLGELTALPRPPSWIEGGLLLRGGEGRKGMGGRGRGGNGRQGGRGMGGEGLLLKGGEAGEGEGRKEEEGAGRGRGGGKGLPQLYFKWRPCHQTFSAPFCFLIVCDTISYS